ncbi:MAG: outer membrane protein assembly factor BamD [Myxococcales bacterium]|nr:outer membrane protein assembly factor BamD [Myxococcales bacterium]
MGQCRGCHGRRNQALPDLGCESEARSSLTADTDPPQATIVDIIRFASHRWLIRSALSFAVIGGGGLASCANVGIRGTHSAPLPGEAAIGLGRGETLPPFSPVDTAAENWKRSEEAFEQERYLVAGRYYVFIRRKFPYSRFAVLSDLRLADVQFQRERWLEAIDGYNSFTRLHPTHDQVPYAMFRIGQAQHELIPNDWFLLPPAHEKDQSAVREASAALGVYLRRYPEDTFADEARRLQTATRTRLLKHEQYAAAFYKRRKLWRGYIQRLETIRKKFADLAVDEQLLLELVKAYAQVRKKPEAAGVALELKNTYPEADEVSKAEEIVEAIQERKPEKDSPKPEETTETADNG